MVEEVSAAEVAVDLEMINSLWRNYDLGGNSHVHLQGL